MAKKSGVCMNIGKPCTKAINREIQTVEATNFVCEECGKELKEKKTTSSKKPNWKLIGGIVVGVLVLGGGAAAILMGGATKIEAISLNKTVLDGEIGDVKFLEASVTPKDVEHTLIWSTTDESVVTVDAGDVSLVGEGEAVVKVKVQEQPEIAAQCMVTVKAKENTVVVPTPVNVTELSLAQSAVTLKINDTLSVALSVLPENADEALIWSSSDTTVVTVSGQILKAIAPGKATVTVEAERSHIKTVLEVTVEKKVEPTQPSTTKSVLGGAATYSSATGVITFLRSTTINLHSRDNEVLHVNRGDKIIGAKVQNGYLIQGEYVDTHGNSQLLTGLNNKLW